MDSEGNEEVTVTRSKDHMTSHDYGGKQELTVHKSCCTLVQMMSYTDLTHYLDHLANSLTGFPLKENDWLIYFNAFPVYIQ